MSTPLPGKTVALISAIPASSASGGNGARIANLARDLREQGHDVHFVFLPSRQSPAFDAAAHQMAFGDGRVHRLNRGSLVEEARYYGKRAAWKVRRRLAAAFNNPAQYYYALDELYPEAFSGQLRRLDLRFGFDVAIVEYVSVSKALCSFASSLKVIDTHDAFGDRHLIYTAAGQRSEGYSITLQAETAGFRRADLVIAIQDDEASRFRQQLGGDAGRVRTVSYSADLTRRVGADRDQAAAFVGSSFEANIDAIGYFTGVVLPLILAADPGFRLFVAGDICRDVADHPNIVKLGRVAEVSDVFALAPVSINPVRIGTGINIKLLDAMASGVATVSTQTGVRGLPRQYRNGVLVVADNNPEAFAQAVLDLSGSAPRRRALGALGHRDAQAWDAQQKAALAALVNEGATRRADWMRYPPPVALSLLSAAADMVWLADLLA